MSNEKDDDQIYEITVDDFLASMPNDPNDITSVDLELTEDDLNEDDVTEEVVLEQQPLAKRQRKPKNYINNADLLVQIALSNEQDQMTDELVNMLTTLCDRYGAKGNFGGYSYIDDMKAYARYMLVRTWRAFKVEKSQNPFAFFTQCIKHSFIQYLNKERNERDIRDKLLVDAGLNPSYTYGGDDDGSPMSSDDY